MCARTLYALCGTQNTSNGFDFMALHEYAFVAGQRNDTLAGMVYWGGSLSLHEEWVMLNVNICACVSIPRRRVLCIRRTPSLGTPDVLCVNYLGLVNNLNGTKPNAHWIGKHHSEHSMWYVVRRRGGKHLIVVSKLMSYLYHLKLCYRAPSRPFIIVITGWQTICIYSVIFK